MENEQINDNPFFVSLSIEGSQLEEVEVHLSFGSNERRLGPRHL